jgi:hypothetical protein
VNGRAFDAQVVLSPPDSKLGQLLQQYVCARVTNMDSIDLGLFDFDRHNALYYFILNADEQIYMRYGGRDAESATSYLNLRSLELALEEGLKMHASGEIPETERPQPLFARDMPLLSKRTLRQGACVECHLIADFQNIQKELDGDLDRVREMYQSPDIKTIGIHLKVPSGLVVDAALGPAAEAGLRSGDTITHVNGTRVRTFGDLQYYYDKVPRDSDNVSLGILRDAEPHILDVPLPERWWLTDLEYRHWTVDPIVFFQTKPLSREQKAALSVPLDGFAGEVTERERFHDFASPPIKVGDIIYGVDEVFEDELANTPELHIKLRHRAGSRMKLHVLRGQERFLSELTTQRQNFRKYSP